MIARITFADGVAEWRDDMTWQGEHADDLNLVTRITLRTLGSADGWPQPIIWQALRDMLRREFDAEFFWSMPDDVADSVCLSGRD